MAASANSGKKSFEIKVLRCTCQSTFQDSKYGTSMRVYNEGSKAFTCTVCGSTVAKSK